jgi:hypothetical protein
MITIVKFSQQFTPSGSGDKWIGMEGVPEPGQTPEEMLDEIVKRINEWNKSRYPVLYTDYFKGPTEVQVEKVSEEKKILETIRQFASSDLGEKADVFSVWVNKMFPEYENHIVVKTILKSKQISQNGKV